VLGDPTHFKLNLTVVLSRDAAEHLLAQSLEREDTAFVGLAGEILEVAAKMEAEDRLPRDLEYPNA
jgi:hypothetical protein